MAETNIEWTHRPGTRGETWNFARGCKAKSPGCANCYARLLAANRMSGPGQPYDGIAVRTSNGLRWTGATTLVPHLLRKPLGWRIPRTVFVDSMADLFYDERPNPDIDDGFTVMLICALSEPRAGHTFIVLTKFAERMIEWATDPSLPDRLARRAGNMMEDGDGWHDKVWNYVHKHGPQHESIWLGVSTEDQQRADERIPLLLSTPAAVRFISYEPALERLDLRRYLAGRMARKVFRDAGGTDEGAIPQHLRFPPSLDWVIAGAESGPGRRPMDEDWVRSVRDQCVAAEVPFFYKQRIGADGRKESTPELDGQRWTQFPEVLNG